MPIQPEQKIFPHVVPPTPVEGGNVRDDVKALYEWVADTTQSLTELNRQIVDKYNMHISGTHAHPSAWAKFRLRRPRYYNDTSGGTTITVPGSASIPSLFVIDGELFEIYANLTCDLSTSGVGGLDTGSVAANTPYYLYGVRDSDSINLIASASDPSTGPTGYDKWTYIGAVCTEPAAATLYGMSSVNGLLSGNDDLELESHTGSTTFTSKTFNAMPTTVRIAFIQGSISGSDATNAIGRISGDNVSGSQGIYIENLSTTEITVHASWIPIFTAQTLYLLTSVSGNTVFAALKGWQEDPTEYP